MPFAKSSSKPPLNRGGILLRATLVAFLVFLAGYVLAFRLGAEDSRFWLSPAAHTLAVARGLAVVMAFAVTWWRLRGRLGTPPPPTSTSRLLRAVAVGVVSAVLATIVATFMGLCGLLAPTGFVWIVGIAAGVMSWRRGRVATNAVEPVSGLRPATVWGTIVACAFSLMVGLPIFGLTLLVWGHTPYAYLPFILAPLAGYFIFRLCTFLDRIGMVRPFSHVLAGAVGELVPGGMADVVDDAVGGAVHDLLSSDR